MFEFTKSSLCLTLSLLTSSILYAESDKMFKIECHLNEASKELRPLLDSWAISNFREYPYLYVYQEETDYNTIFEVDPTAFVLSAESQGEKIGLLKANSLDSPFLENDAYTPFAVLDQIRSKGYNPEEVLYISSFLTTKEHRLDQTMVNALFDHAAKLAKKSGKKYVCYMEIVHNLEHPLKPNPYIPVEPWSALHVDFKNIGVEIKIAWPTLQPDGLVKEETHRLAIFMTSI